MERLLYISASRLDSTTAEADVDAIAAWSRNHNPPLQITGALLFTGTYFAQILEGQTQALDVLMATICKDTRHHDVQIKCRLPITVRKFPDWAMAYHGQSQFVTRYIVDLSQAQTPSEIHRACARLVDLAHEFTAAAPAL